MFKVWDINRTVKKCVVANAIDQLRIKGKLLQYTI